MAKRFYKTAVFDHPKVEAPVNREQVNRCPNCNSIWSKGDLSEGTVLEIKCSKCLYYFVEVSPILEKKLDKK